MIFEYETTYHAQFDKPEPKPADMSQYFIVLRRFWVDSRETEEKRTEPEKNMPKTKTETKTKEKRTEPEKRKRKTEMQMGEAQPEKKKPKTQTETGETQENKTQPKMKKLKAETEKGETKKKKTKVIYIEKKKRPAKKPYEWTKVKTRTAPISRLGPFFHFAEKTVFSSLSSEETESLWEDGQEEENILGGDNVCIKKRILVKERSELQKYVLLDIGHKYVVYKIGESLKNQEFPETRSPVP